MSFVFWGMLNGIYQVLEEMIGGIKSRILTFVLVDFAWIFFRAGSIHETFYIIKNMFANWGSNYDVSGFFLEAGISTPKLIVLVICILILLIMDICKKKNIVVHKEILSRNIYMRSFILACGIVAILIFGKYGFYDASNFIYFQF